jgi:L-lactate dehydrogenase complex protein LldE
MTLLELPAAEQCCGFGGTFALKNADTSTAMLADRMRNVLDTGAEALTAGDSSCLMHIGGGLSRLRSGTKTVHLAEILASTDAPAPHRASPAGAGAGVPAPDDEEITTSVRTPAATGGGPA